MNINAVMQAAARIISKSIGAKIIPGKALNMNPTLKRYKCPLRRIISPIYIRNVIIEAAIDGIHIEKNFRFSKGNEPTNTPQVTPKRIKNAAIKVADKRDT